MRIAVDTNVFVSAGLKASSWPAMVVRSVGRYGGLLKSEPTERQVVDVLRRPYIAAKLPQSYLREIQEIFDRSELVSIREKVTACRDPPMTSFSSWP